MKKYIILVLVVFFHSVSSFSQIIPGLNYSKMVGHGKGMNITFTDPQSGQSITKYAGQIVGYVNPGIFTPPTVSIFYSINIFEDPVFQDTSYVDTEINMNRTILNLFYLYSYILSLPNDSSTAASLQAIIWRETNQLNIGSITDSTVKARAEYVINYLGINWTDCFPEQSLKLRSIGIDQVQVEAFLPLCLIYGPVPKIYLRITEGELSDTIIDIDENGISPLVTVSGASNGAIISAFAPLLPNGPASQPGRLIPTSEIFRSLHGGPVILAHYAKGFPSYKIDWGTLPVELTSFTSIINENNVVLNWITTSETNNSEFQVQRKSIDDWETMGYVQGHGTSTSSHAYQFTDKDVQSGKYNYRLKQIDYNGNYEYYNLSNEVLIGTPEKFELKQNYPNPFNPTTRIEYTIPYNGVVTLIVYDINGREISSLVKESKQAGYYSVDFDCSNLSSGIYYYRLVVGNYKVTKRMMLIK